MEKTNSGKKWIIILAVLLVAAIAVIIVLAVNGSKGGDGAGDGTETTEHIQKGGSTSQIYGADIADCFAVDTPYGKLYVPAEYESEIKSETVEEDGRTEIRFYTEIDGEKYHLYSVFFGEGAGDIVFGTVKNLKGEDVPVALGFGDIAEGQPPLEGEKFDRYSELQETMNDMASHLSELTGYSE